MAGIVGQGGVREPDDDDLLVAVDVAADPGLGRHGGAGDGGPGGGGDPGLLQGGGRRPGPGDHPGGGDGGQGGQHGHALHGAQLGGVADERLGEADGRVVTRAGGQVVPHRHEAAPPDLGRQRRLGPQQLAPGGAEHPVEQPGHHGVALGVLGRRERPRLVPPDATLPASDPHHGTSARSAG